MISKWGCSADVFSRGKRDLVHLCGRIISNARPDNSQVDKLEEYAAILRNRAVTCAQLGE